MALTPEQIKASLKTLKPSQITEQKAPVIMPSTTTTTTNIMPKVTQVQPLSPKQNIMSPSLEVQSGVQPEKDYKKLATPQEIATFAKMIRAGEDPEQAKRGMQKVIDRRLAQENIARGQEPKNYISPDPTMSLDMYNQQQSMQQEPLYKATQSIGKGFTEMGKQTLEGVKNMAEGTSNLVGRGIDTLGSLVGEKPTFAPEGSFGGDVVDIAHGAIAPYFSKIAPVGTTLFNAAADFEPTKPIVEKLGEVQQYLGNKATNLPLVKQFTETLNPDQQAKLTDILGLGVMAGAGKVAGKVVGKGIEKATPYVEKVKAEIYNPNKVIPFEAGKNKIVPIKQTEPGFKNKIAEGLVSSYLKNPAEVEKYKAKTGQTPAKTILEAGIKGNLQEQGTQILEKGKQSAQLARTEASKIPETFKSPEGEWITNKVIEGVDTSIPGISDKLKPIIEMNNRFKNGTATANDIIDAKTMVSRYEQVYDDFGRVKKTGDVFEKEALANMYNKMKTTLEDSGKKYNVDFEAINKETMKWEGLRKLITRAISREEGRDNIGLTDYVLGGYGAMVDPVSSLLLVGAKKIFQMPRVTNKVANMLYSKDKVLPIKKTNASINNDSMILNNSMDSGTTKVKGLPLLPEKKTPITPTGVVQEATPIAPVPTVQTKTPIVEKGRATHDPYKTVTMDTKVVAPKKTVVPKPNNNLVDLQRSTLHTEVTKPLSRAEARTGNFETQFGKIEDIVFDRGREKLVIDGKQYLPSEVKIFERKPVADFDNILKEKVPVKTKEEGYISEIAKQEGQKASMLKQVSDDMVDTAKLSPSELSEYNDLLARAIQGRGENGATALEKLYNKYGKDVYGKTKTIVPVKQEVVQSTTAQKKQSVVPKPQEKQAVLDGKKEELLFRYANKENINSDMYRGGTWYGEKDLISHYKNKDKNIALGGKELFQAPKKIEKPYSVNTDDYEVGKDILMMTKFGKSGSKLGYGERPNFVKDILDENTYNKVLDIVFEKEDDILLKQLKSLLPKEKYDLISKQPFYNQKTMTVDYLLSQRLKKMGYDGIELLENGKKREVMIFDKKSPVPTPKSPVNKGSAIANKKVKIPVKEDIKSQIADNPSQSKWQVRGSIGLPKKQSVNATHSPKISEDIVVYRGGTSDGKYTSTSKTIAEDYAKSRGGSVSEYVLPKGSKIIDYNNIPGIKYKGINDYDVEKMAKKENKSVLEFMNSDVENDYTFAEDYAKLMGYDAIKYPTEGEIRIINASKVKPKKIPLKTSGVDNLIEEAKKYKSAEEFENKISNTPFRKRIKEGLGVVWRGEGKNASMGEGLTKSYSITKEGAGKYGDVSMYKLNDNIKIGNAQDITKSLDYDVYGKEFIQKAKELGFDGIRTKGNEVVIYDNNKVYQLKQIREQANKKQPNPLQSKTPAKAQDSLLAEARKYKSADEFVKAQGTPVYHGTPEKFDNFSLEHVGKSTDSGMFGEGIYFTDDLTEATTYSKRGNKVGEVKEVILDLKKPYIIKTKADIPKIDVPNETIEQMGVADKEYSRLFTEKLQKEGYDGVIDMMSPGSKQYVVFNPSQIKTKSQLEDIWKQANQATAEQSLIQEAKKYKSADEFEKKFRDETYNANNIDMKISNAAKEFNRKYVPLLEDNTTKRYKETIQSIVEDITLDTDSMLEKIKPIKEKLYNYQKSQLRKIREEAQRQ